MPRHPSGDIPFHRQESDQDVKFFSEDKAGEALTYAFKEAEVLNFSHQTWNGAEYHRMKNYWDDIYKMF